MRTEITVAAESRDSRGKNEARRLRVKGSVPAIVYGGVAEPASIAVSPKDLTKILNSKSGHNTIFNLSIAGAAGTPVMIVDWQFDPIKDSLLHADLKRIDLTVRMTVTVPVLTQGEPKGVKLQGGLYEVVTRELEIECLPNDIPEQFVINVADLMIGDTIRASDIPMGESRKLLTLPETVISHVVAPRAEAEPAAAEGVAAEPEVAKKGKKEEGTEAAAPPAKKK